MTVSDLPVKKGPKVGARSFTDEEEELIYRFVQIPGNTRELAAVHCRITKAGVDKIIARVIKRMNTNE